MGAHGTIEYDEGCIRRAPRARQSAVVDKIVADMKKKRPLLMMLGDTSMGMINGYFGPQRLAKSVSPSTRSIRRGSSSKASRSSEERIDDALAFVKDKGVNSTTAATSPKKPTRGQLRGYCAVLDLLEGVPRRLHGLAVPARTHPSLPPSDFAEGLLNSTCRPESNGARWSSPPPRPTRATLIPMEMMKRLLQAQGPARGGRCSTTCAGAPSTRALALGAAELGSVAARTPSTTTPTR